MSRSSRSHRKSGLRSSSRDNALLKRFEGLEGRQLFAAHVVGDPTVYASIQAAVDAALPNAVINVDAGSYAEQVSIFKPLTINGARSGSDARSNQRLASGGAGESVLTGATFPDNTVSSIFRIGADGVTIDGFTLQGETSQGDTTGAAVVILPNVSGTRLLDNIVQNNVAGVFLSNSSATNATLIQHNTFRSNNNPGVNSGRGIYTNGSINGGILQNVTIDGNWFTLNTGDPATTTGVEAAIALQTRAPDSQHDIRVTNNVFDNNGKALLAFSSYNLTISGNTITYSRDQWSGALRFEGGDHDITITGNTLYANTGPSIRIDNKGIDGANYNYTITNNNFFGNGYNTSKEAILTYGDQFSGTMNATNNWFGSASGPGGQFAGTGDRIYGNGASINITPFATTPFPYIPSPFTGLGQGTDALIQIEDFDHGGEGIAYHDLDAANNGALKYRGNQGVDLQTTTDAGGGANLSFVKAGEWLQYTILVGQTGTYNLDVRVANTISGGTFHFEVDGVNITGPMVIPNTGGFQVFKTLTKSGISLSAGQHTVRLVMDVNASSGSIGNFNWFRFVNTTPIPAPSAPSNLLATAIDTNKVSLAWADNSSNEFGFIIERKTGTGAWQLLATLGANTTSYLDTTAIAGTSYTYHVRATGQGGDSANSNDAAANTPASVVYLSDIPSVSATNGYGPVEKDMNNGQDVAGDGTAIVLNGVTYSKGLGAHAPSEVVYALNGAYTNFQSDVGVDDHQTTLGSVIFQIFADGVKVFDSGVMGANSATQHINLNITGVNQLKLVVTDGGDGTGNDWADWAGAFLIAAPPSAPNAPTGLTASAVSWNQVNLSWTDVNNETGFKIERSIDGVNFIQIGTSNAGVTTYSDTTVNASTQYTYRVRATNNIGDSGYSNTSPATTPAQPTVPAAPGTLGVTPVAYNRIDLAWGDVATETGYKIERSLDGTNFTQIGTTTADVTTYSDTSVGGSTKYYYRVRASNGVGDSTYTNIANATTPVQPAVPAAPANLAVNAVSATRIDLSWGDVATETGFKIERSTDGLNFTQIGTTAGGVVTYSDTTVAGATKYYYRVRASNNVGDSQYSTVANATTPAALTAPAAPANLVATAGSTAIALAWSDNSTNEDGFRVERSTDGVNFTQLVLTTNASYMDQGIVAGTKYYYRVQAYNNAGNSAYTNTANATVVVVSGPQLPANWSQADVGSTGATGSATYSNGAYTVKGAGGDIGGNKDAYHYVYQQITGDATIIVRVTGVQDTDNNAKAGIMFRNTLDAGSKEAGLFMTPDNGLKFLTRNKTGGSTQNTSVTGKVAPYWLKLVRLGDTFKAYRSSDGVNWTKIGEQTISMNSTIYVGLAVTSHKSGTLNTSTFDNVSIA
jgi:fibronectin type 3 domain-containing protein